MAMAYVKLVSQYLTGEKQKETTKYLSNSSQGEVWDHMTMKYGHYPLNCNILCKMWLLIVLI